MQVRRVVRQVARGLIFASAAVWVSVGCSRQGEGERCDYRWGGDSDCDDGLKCYACEFIQGSTVDRCCKISGTAEDERCEVVSPVNPINVSGLCGSDSAGRSGTAGTAGTAGGGGTAGSGGTTDTAGTAGTDTAGTANNPGGGAGESSGGGG
ncbi:MAG TPA: hypothetical protein VGK73_23525 [Polyangiaceae bacterium]